MFCIILSRITWVSILLLFNLFCPSHQTSSNDLQNSIDDLHNLILGKWADLEKKISEMDIRLRQVDTIIKNSSQTPMLIDINKKLDKIDTNIINIETEVAACQQSFSQSPMLIDIKQQVETIKTEVADYGQNYSQSSILVDIKQTVDKLETEVAAYGQCSLETTLNASTIANSGNSKCLSSDGFFIQGSTICYKALVNQKISWTTADRQCKSEGLVLAEPSSETVNQLRAKLNEKYGDKQYWVGGRGTGAIVQFVRGIGSSVQFVRGRGLIYPDDPLWRPGHPNLNGYTNKQCLGLSAHGPDLKSDPSSPYWTYTCSFHVAYALCESVSE